MPAKKSISKLKKELDKWFSLYIRLRDAMPNSGLVKCFTCPITKHYKDGMQCGHFMSRRHMATRYHELNQIQCIKCNMFEQGMQYVYGLNLDAKYGEGCAEELQVLSRTTLKMSRVDYEDNISYYKTIVDNLKKEKGLE